MTLELRTGWPLRVANPISPRHIHAGFCGDKKDWHEEMVQHFGLTYQTRDIRHVSPPPPQFDTAGGGASAAMTVETLRPEDNWISREFLCGITVQVFRKSSRAVKPKSIPVMYNKGGIFQVDLEKDRLKGKAIPANDLLPQHPGPRPAPGKCWMVLEGPWQGKYVRPIRYTMHVDRLEGVEREVPHWEVFEVIRDHMQPDIPGDMRLFVRDDHLIVLGESQQVLKLNMHLNSYHVGSRVDPWIVGPHD